MPESQNTMRWENLPASCLDRGSLLFQHWERLNAERGDLPILAGNAVVSALETLGTGRERLLIGRIANSVLAMAILEQSGRFQWRTFQPSQLPLGAWVASSPMSLEHVARSLARGPLGLCLILSMTQVDPLVAPRANDEADIRHSDYIDSGWINIDGNFDRYWAERGKNLRQNMRKQRTKLRADGVQLSLDVLRLYDEMAPAIAQYGELESAGWKSKEGTAIHPDNAQGRFYRNLMEHASQTGGAIVYRYRFDEQVVAMNLCLLRADTLVVLKTTYNESIKAFSPAFLLQETVLELLHGEGQVKRLEYFGRMMDWHTKWTSQQRTLYHLTLYRWAFIKKLATMRKHTDPQGPVAPKVI